MSYVTAAVTIVVTVCWYSNATIFSMDYSSVVSLKQGHVRGLVVAVRTNRTLFFVEQYRGIPYARPPVGDFRFMPPGSAPGFGSKIKYANTFGPVCPQKFPDPERMTPERRAEFYRLQQFLMNESEDCLYLNIYVPYREPSWNGSFPVMVFIHGESFEWSSGNPYDGTALAGYGKVIVVTLNYRLGVLGFLKTGSKQYLESNFGLVDQIAALVWVKDNIQKFGGNPNAVTLFGHGTGAACASLLTLSPLQENQTLFHRAILMAGSALSDWAIAPNPLQVAYQVGKALNCQFPDDFAACLRRKRLDEIMNAPVETPPYTTRFGPVVDSIVIPNDPKKLMTTYTNIFRRFELMYGVTELESIHLLPEDGLTMLKKDRDEELGKYLRTKCEMHSEWCLARTLAEYAGSDFKAEGGYGQYSGQQMNRATETLLEILSDARTVAPMVQMGKYHSALNKASYFYVFTYNTFSKEKEIRHKTSTGDELPYVFGVPLVGSSFHFTDHYTEKEQLLSEMMMTFFSNFAHNGDPKTPHKDKYYTLNFSEWNKFDVDWRPFDSNEQLYFQLDIPTYQMSDYRSGKMKFWNEEISDFGSNSTKSLISDKSKQKWPKGQPPFILTNPPRKSTFIDRYENFHKPLNPTGVIRITGTSAPDNMMGNVVYGTVVKAPGSSGVETESKGISTTVTIAMCSIFLLSNLCLFVVLYLTCYRKRKMRSTAQKNDETPVAPAEVSEAKLMDGCNIIKIVTKSERSDDTYEAVKTSRSGRFKIPRQMSNSTIDAHTKVRDWITNEIVYKYSPRFRRPRHSNDSRSQDTKVNTNLISDACSTLGRSPTRPVSPTEPSTKPRPPLLKSSSIPVQNKRHIEKVSVAIDATPTGRGPSVLAQQPIELTKSLDRPNFEVPLRRSLTMEDFSVMQPSTIANKQELRKSTTSINLKFPPRDAPTVIRIEHCHSKSDPVQDFSTKKLKTFDPSSDINVTCRENEPPKVPLTPEESLMTIKRRNFPKVLPDYPSREALAKKRRSMPVANHTFSPIPEGPGQFQPRSPTHKTFGKLPPAPPVRTTSTLTRKPGGHIPPVCQSAPVLVQEPSPSPEPELAYNNLYVGPLIPRMKKTELSSSESSKLNTQPIYDKLKAVGGSDKGGAKTVAKTIITTDPDHPIKKIEPKVIIKPTMARNVSDPKKHIPRVNLHETFAEEDKKLLKPSQIPGFVKGKSSSSESTPSSESDTGTVVKRM